MVGDVGAAQAESLSKVSGVRRSVEEDQQDSASGGVSQRDADPFERIDRGLGDGWHGRMIHAYMNPVQAELIAVARRLADVADAGPNRGRRLFRRQARTLDRMHADGGDSGLGPHAATTAIRPRPTAPRPTPVSVGPPLRTRRSKTTRSTRAGRAAPATATPLGRLPATSRPTALTPKPPAPSWATRALTSSPWATTSRSGSCTPPASTSTRPSPMSPATCSSVVTRRHRPGHRRQRRHDRR